MSSKIACSQDGADIVDSIRLDRCRADLAEQIAEILEAAGQPGGDGIGA